MPQKKEDKQEISAENINGDVTATNVHIDKIEININSDFLGTKSFEKKDKDTWEKEELVLSVEDIHMVKEIIKKEEEISETLPILSGFKLIFDVLPTLHKGLFITALQRINRENKLTKRLYKETGEVITELDKDTIDLLNEEDQDEDYSKIFIPDIYEGYKRIYNIIRCGDLERKIIPFIKQLTSKISDKEEIKKHFEKFWCDRLYNHPYAVFVNSTENKWEFEIFRKFNNKEKENVRVYARSEGRVFFAEYICKELAKDTKKKINIKRYYLGSERAIEIIFED